MKLSNLKTIVYVGLALFYLYIIATNVFRNVEGMTTTIETIENNENKDKKEGNKNKNDGEDGKEGVDEPDKGQTGNTEKEDEIAKEKADKKKKANATTNE